MMGQPKGVFVFVGNGIWGGWLLKWLDIMAYYTVKSEHDFPANAGKGHTIQYTI